MLRLLLFISLAVVPALSEPLRAEATRDDRESLEDLRERLSAELAAQVAEVQPRVDALLLEIAAARRERSPRRAAEKREALAALPPAAALVLVERLEVTDEEDEAQMWRALEAGYALRRVSSAAILPRLDELSNHTTATTRRLAIAALGAVPNPTGAARSLTALYAKRSGADRAEVLGALVRLGGPDSATAFEDAVTRADRQSVAAALSAAAARVAVEYEPIVDAALANQDLAKDVWSPLLEFIESKSGPIEPERVKRLVALPLAGSVRGDDAAELLERVGRLDLARRHVEDELDALTRSSSERIATAALVALTRMGDREAKDQLMEKLDEDVDEADKGLPNPLRARGQMKMRIGDYTGAINDLKKALREAKGQGGFVLREINVDLARAYLLNERLDKAAGALEDADLTNPRREELAALREFRVLAEHPRYGEVFEPR
ncbi:hypothetical protein Pla163_23520 [Planctomycetes bacterium Pla163]|uniref:HEAT repeat protein n=1 Tax=Rohdeia mirabilis TaxID=2528008 RepID=A0A518D178_9BACT|nr:hypothetical protein Pla163_23520 [Planctomycetes bacterium Pla163]